MNNTPRFVLPGASKVRRPRVLHLTTTPMSLWWLLAAQLHAFRAAGFEVMTASGPGEHRDALIEAGFEQQITRLADLFVQDEDFYRAAFVAGDRSGLFEQRSNHGIFARSLQQPVEACKAAQAEGLLNGAISAEQLGRQVYNSYRLARQDWANGYFDLDGFRSQALTGVFMILAADAAPPFRERLLRRIEELA